MRGLHRVTLLVFALLMASCGREVPPRAAATRPPVQPGLAPAAVSAEDDPRSLGEVAAPITIVEYSDFQCPFCASFVRETRPQIEEAYVKTGKVRLVYRDYPLVQIHPAAVMASHVVNCAADQGRFWEMHRRLFDGYAAGEWGGGGDVDLRRFLTYAAELELDAAVLQECVTDGRHAARIAADVREGAERGVQSTPSFLVNGQLVIGARSFEYWRQLLDEMLAAR